MWYFLLLLRQSWISERKLTERVNDLQPSPWFQEKHASGNGRG